ncbi:hypothetical protein GPK38_07195 [Enterococcus faecium]|nr:hypothetical protein [Enterococcus faecium]MBT9709867.1 hypothetical protein [Enterococcus faecium]
MVRNLNDRQRKHTKRRKPLRPFVMGGYPFVMGGYMGNTWIGTWVVRG